MAEAALAYSPSVNQNSRKYDCSIINCNNKAYAKGYCNAHYIRSRNNMDMSKPIRATHSGEKCKFCDKAAGGSGGWGLCTNHYRIKRRRILRSESIKIMGGKCSHCFGKFPDVAFDFHHLDESKKEMSTSDMLDSKSLEKISLELSKCILLCANCHRIEHHGSQ